MTFDSRLREVTQVVDGCIYSTQNETILAERGLDMSHFLLQQVRKLEGIVYVIGNGGSAGIASHFCTDLLRTLEMSASTISDSNIITCFANDLGYENVYKIPLMRNLRPCDLLVAISSSGQSQNILEAVKVAKSKKISTMTLSGFSPSNPLRRLGDLNFWLDSTDYGLVETGHFFLLHTIVDTCKAKSENLTSSAI